MAGLAFHRYAPVMAVGDLAAHRQADARARIFSAAVEPLKDAEDAVTVSFVKADAVVFHRESKQASGGGTAAPVDGWAIQYLAPDFLRLEAPLASGISVNC